MQVAGLSPQIATTAAARASVGACVAGQAAGARGSVWPEAVHGEYYASPPFPRPGARGAGRSARAERPPRDSRFPEF